MKARGMAVQHLDYSKLELSHNCCVLQVWDPKAVSKHTFARFRSLFTQGEYAMVMQQWKVSSDGGMAARSANDGKAAEQVEIR